MDVKGSPGQLQGFSGTSSTESCKILILQQACFDGLHKLWCPAPIMFHIVLLNACCLVWMSACFRMHPTAIQGSSFVLDVQFGPGCRQPKNMLVV